MLIIIAVLGIFAAIGVSTINDGVLSGSRETKLRHDVNVLNSAASTYQAFGGDLEGLSNPEDILRKLKSQVSEEQRGLIPGLGGSFIDENIEFVMQTEEEASTDMPRLRWEPSRKKFIFDESGALGIKSLKINPFGGANVAENTEDRLGTVTYSSKTDWIWDYADTSQVIPEGPTQIPLSVQTNPASIPSTFVPVSKSGLMPPSFSIPGGDLPAFTFPLSLHLGNPNPTGTSKLIYNINFGEWVSYDSSVPISVPEDSVIQAQAVPFRPAEWNASQLTNSVYNAFVSKLLPPIIDFSKDKFSGEGDSISVTLTNINFPAISGIFYQIVPVPGKAGATTEFLAYSSEFPVSSTDYPSGFGVRAFAVALKSGYTDSRIESKFATDVGGLFEGHLDLDTSTTIASINGGDTEAHTHDITTKFGINTIDFFAIPDTKQININEAIRNPNQKFKLIIVNGNLSPGLSLVMTHENGGVSQNTDTPVDQYDNTEIKDLSVLSLGGGSGSSRLTSLKMTMTQDVILQAGVIPTNTGDVKGNTLGKQDEWRNGALTLQAVSVDSSGDDAFTTDFTLSNGDHGAASSGLLWEATLFWHWDGDSYQDNDNRFEPGRLLSIIENLDDPEAAAAYLATLRATELAQARAALVKAEKDAQKAVNAEREAEENVTAAREATIAAAATGDEAALLAAQVAEGLADEALKKASGKVKRTAQKVIDKALALEELEKFYAADS